MHNMVKYGLFDESEEGMLRKCTVFYSAIGTEQPPKRFELDNIGKLSAQQIKRDLELVLHKEERFNLELIQQETLANESGVSLNSLIKLTYNLSLIGQVIFIGDTIKPIQKH